MISKEKKIILFICLAALPALIRADQVKLSAGKTYSGAITGADKRSVFIQISDTQTVKIPHSHVSSIFFRYADRVYLLSGEVIKCKVLTQIVPDLFIVSENGPRKLKISELKRYFYNDADSLSISYLPPTGAVFNNLKSIDLMNTELNRALFLSLSAGILSVPAQSWQENFITASSLLGLTGQAQLGFYLQRNLAVYGGFLYGHYKNTAEGNLKSEINSGYLHLGVTYYSRAFEFLPGTGFLVSADAGLLNVTGNLYTYSYRDIALDGLKPNIAGRILIGARTFLMSHFDAYLKTGYFFAQSFKLTVPAVQRPYDINLPLGGWMILGGISVYISF